ncbi:hypothetical protein [Hasllibacter sp. MH4015]|uniref:hypothetical protein n=1 Tax=Hasllibacter sp. MH4015 TaxID=2854029 RepID=UPI001CD777F9|nr:hypothetical protein [Hasllibacter sp. MH4015]
MRLVTSLVIGVAAAPSGHAGAQGMETCVNGAMEAFEVRLSAALNAQAAPNFDLVRGREVGDCGGIALLQCGAEEACRSEAADEMRAQAARFAAVPVPADVSGRFPPWSDGLYPQLWTRVTEGCDGCAPDAMLEHLGDAASLWQVARVVGVVEAGAWR